MGELHDYLYSEQVTERLLDWSEDEAPGREAGDFDVIKFCAEKTIRAKIQDEIKRWETETKATKDLSDRLRSMFIEECQLLSKSCVELDLLIEGTENSCDFQTVISKSKLLFNNNATPVAYTGQNIKKGHNSIYFATAATSEIYLSVHAERNCIISL